MEAAYTDAWTHGHTLFTGYVPAYTIPDGMTLTCGIYNWTGVVNTPSGAAVALELTFDGQGDPNSV